MEYEAPAVVAVTPVDRPLIGIEAASVGSFPINPQWHEAPDAPAAS